MNVILEVEKNDCETNKKLEQELGNADKVDLNSFGGLDFVQYIVPVLTVLAASPVLIELIKSRKVKVKYKGIEIEGDYKNVNKILRDLDKNKKKNNQGVNP